MKTIKALILSFLSIFIGFTTQAQRAKHGNYTVSTMNDVVNTYTSLTASASAGDTSITVASNLMNGAHFTNELREGDLIMIIQMYGANVDINTTPVVSWGSAYTIPDSYITGNWNEFPEHFGQITAYNDAGKFEQVEVASVSGSNTINLQCALKNNYDFSKKVQVIRIPRYENLTVNNASSIVPLAWDGTVGGVVALEVNTSLTMNPGSLISADEFGFRGGAVDLSGSSGSNVAPQSRFLGSPSAFEGSEKGESIFGYHTELDAVYSRYGIGASANGGGGAGYENAGGGGGSNIFIGAGTYTGNGTPIGYAGAWNQEFAGFGGSTSPGGGRGGYSQARNNRDAFSVGPDNTLWGGDARKNNGGRGGHPLAYDPTRLFFGGGGGAGDDNSNQAGAGGRGGGIVYISNYGTTTGTGTISANGQDGQNANPNNFVIGGPIDRIGIDGAGGGGAGGSIFIENAVALPATITLSSQGGDGGSQVLRYATAFLTPEADGPGGSGTGGSIAFNSGSPVQLLDAGANGTSTNINNTNLVAEFPPNGATTGNNGFGSLPAPYFDLTIRDTAICGGSVDLTVTVLGSTSGTIGWYMQQFGGSPFDTGLSTTVSPAVTTTYYVGACPGTFRVPVTVTINTADDASFTSGDFCATSVNTISGVVTPSGTFSISAQTGSGSATINPTTGVLAGFSVGDQITIQYTTPAGPCQNSSTQVVNVTAGDDASFTTGDFCASTVNTISGVVTPSGTFSIASQTGSGSATINPTTGVLSGFSAGDQITIQYTTPAGGCQNSSTQVVNVFDLPVINVSNDGPICAGGSFNLNETGGDAVSWNWSTSSGAVITTNTDQSPSVSGATDGDVFNLTITDANTCTNTGSTTVSVIQSPVLDPIANVTNCGPYALPAIQGTNLTGSEAYYDNSIASGGVPITGPVLSSQTVWVYDGIATCEDEISFDVTINPLPTVTSFTGGNNYCVGDVIADVVVEVSGSADWDLDYTLDGVAQSVNSSSSTISLGNTPGVYVLTNLSDMNCSASVSGTQTILVTAVPAQPVASGDATYCEDDPMSDMIVSGAGGTYTWYSDNTLTTVYGTGSSIAPLNQTMTYYVTESLNGCESTADDVMITIETCDIIYPTAFTPDGDGTNDTWEILGLDEKYPENVVRIYNRWGNLMFEHKSSVTNPYDNNRWDGTYKGSPLPVGSFYYIIDLDGKSNQETGTVSIILN